MADSEDGEEEGSFKIRDRRRFDAEGALKNSSEEPKRKENKSREASGKGDNFILQGESNTEGRSSNEAPPIDFSSFMMSLATQALAQLGEVKLPGGVEIPVDYAAARQTIDLVDMLKAKTEGNLDSDEKALIEEILHSLRMSYVRKVK